MARLPTKSALLTGSSGCRSRQMSSGETTIRQMTVHPLTVCQMVLYQMAVHLMKLQPITIHRMSNGSLSNDTYSLKVSAFRWKNDGKFVIRQFVAWPFWATSCQEKLLLDKMSYRSIVFWPNVVFQLSTPWLVEKLLSFQLKKYSSKSVLSSLVKLSWGSVFVTQVVELWTEDVDNLGSQYHSKPGSFLPFLF